MMLAMILVPITRFFWHTGPTGMTVRHHANDHEISDQPAIWTDYGRHFLQNG